MKKLNLLWLLVLASCATSTTPHDIANFTNVPGHMNVWRGGQPMSPAGWAYLQSLGITKVIKMNAETEGSDDEARKLGMRVYSYPINWEHQTLLRPNLADITNAVSIIGPGTYIHCTHGQDRTGLVVGCLRVWGDRWPKQAAYDEMLRNGFHPSLHGLNDCWEDSIR